MKIIGANRDDIYIEVTLPVDEDGEYAFDEKGKAIKGKSPVVLKFPRYDCLKREELKALEGRMDALGDDTPLSERIYGELQALLQDFVTPDVLELVENLRLAEVKQIADHVREVNKMTVGEFLASPRS